MQLQVNKTKGYFLKSVPLEYQMLWQVSKKKRLENANLRDQTQRYVRNARLGFRQQFGVDDLEQRALSYSESGSYSTELMRRISKRIYEDKSPDSVDLGQWISLEIELVMPKKSAETEFVAFVRRNGWSKLITIKDDGSIKLRTCSCEDSYDDDTEQRVVNHTEDCEADGKNAYGREIVVTAKIGDWAFIKAVCDKLNAIGCTVNKTCGLHVHFDMRHMSTAQKVSIIGHRLAKAVPALKQMLPASRQNNSYCQKIINRINDPDRGDVRYTFVNLTSYRRHRTLEVRGHSGTTDAEKIINWVKILKTIMDKPNRKVITTVGAMVERYGFEADLATYALNRALKFASSRNQNPADDVARDNRAAESGQPSLDSNLVTIDTERTDGEYTVTINGQEMALSFSQLEPGLDAASYSFIGLDAQIRAAQAQNNEDVA